ncbi:MAG TPA: outer membrane beta-barrel protein [Thermoanaerobaculia bacterium]|nr:outer membrane beta-barrel protein [Thermoanaerobaculia bacterium]
MPTTTLSRAWIMLAVALPAAVAVSAPAAAEHRLGLGANYWRSIDELADERDIEDDGLAYFATYQYRPGGLLGLQIDLEHFDEGFGGGTEEAYSPQVYLLVGSGWYAGLGAGVLYHRSGGDSTEDEFSDVFYAAKVGLNMQLVPKVYLDLGVNYRFDAIEDLDEAESDALFLGAAVRFGF